MKKKKNQRLELLKRFVEKKKEKKLETSFAIVCLKMLISGGCIVLLQKILQHRWSIFSLFVYM